MCDLLIAASSRGAKQAGAGTQHPQKHNLWGAWLNLLSFNEKCCVIVLNNTYTTRSQTINNDEMCLAIITQQVAGSSEQPATFSKIPDSLPLRVCSHFLLSIHILENTPKKDLQERTY